MDIDEAKLLKTKNGKAVLRFTHARTGLMLQRMSRPLAAAFMLTDLIFLAYWSVSGLAQIGVIHIPTTWMYADYDKANVVAWNWSFLPVDLAFSVTGISAVAASRHDHPVWRPLALLSLTLTLVAGLMALSYWTILCQFDLIWFLPNVALVVWPLLFLPGLIRVLASRVGTQRN